MTSVAQTTRSRRGATGQAGSGPHWLRRTVGPGHKLAALILAGSVLAFGALLGVGWSAGFRDVWEVAIHPHWVWLPAAVGAEVAAYVGYTLAYRETVRAEDGIELETSKAAVLVAVGFSVFMQGGGFALDREAVGRAGLSEDESRRRVLTVGTLEYAILAPAAAIAAYFVYGTVRPSMTLPWMVGVPAGALLSLTALRYRDRIARSAGWRAHLGHALAAIGRVLRMVCAPRRSWLAFAGMTAYWIGDVFCLWAALHLFRAEPPPTAQLIVGYASGYALTRRALPLAGAGIVEALLPFALTWVGISLPQALLAVIVYRAINLWLPMVPALVAIPTLARLEQRAARAAEGHTAASAGSASLAAPSWRPRRGAQ